VADFQNKNPINRTALVTGAARGIGLATVRKLLDAGHRVAMADRDAEALAAAASQLPGDRVLALPADITAPDAPAAFERAIIARWAPVSILVNNAGLPSPKRNGRAAGFVETTDEEWCSIIAVNLTAVFRISRQFLPPMRAQRWGRVINIASLAGRGRTLVAGASYMASKAGVLALTRAIAAEFGPDGITANSIAPGLIDTSMAAGRPPEANAAVIQQIPVRRIGRPEEVGAAVAFLAGEDAGFINGAVIDVNGGVWMA
jgi:3-oxoacyl-[acyl-carrier protein] reductase